MAVGLLLGYLVANGSHCGNMLWCSGSSSRTIALQQLVLNAGPGSEAAAAQQQPEDQEGRSKKWAYAFYVTAPGVSEACRPPAALRRLPCEAQQQANYSHPPPSCRAVPVCSASEREAAAGAAARHPAGGHCHHAFHSAGWPKGYAEQY